MTTPSLRDQLGLAPASTGGVPVLFMSSNGVGMGHLTRLLAIALRCEPAVRPVFLSLSRAAGVVAGFDLPWEHVSSHTNFPLPQATWHGVLRDRVVRAVDRWGARAVVFDGVAPYRGLQWALEDRPEVRSAWVRRGLWIADRVDQRGDADWFDIVVQPGELGPDDPPPDEPVVVGPVTLVERDQLASRAEARRELGLPEDGRVLLLALGSGMLTDVATPTRAAMEVLADGHWTVARPQSPLPGDLVPAGMDVHTFSAYPMARLFRAFDAAITASGYNSFHELVVGEVPSLFVPQPRNTDDQARRARHAVEAGVGLAAASVADVPERVRDLVDEEVRRGLGRALTTRPPVRGAEQAAAAVVDLVSS